MKKLKNIKELFKLFGWKIAYFKIRIIKIIIIRCKKVKCFYQSLGSISRKILYIKIYFDERFRSID